MVNNDYTPSNQNNNQKAHLKTHGFLNNKACFTGLTECTTICETNQHLHDPVTLQ